MTWQLDYFFRPQLEHLLKEGGVEILVKELDTVRRRCLHVAAVGYTVVVIGWATGWVFHSFLSVFTTLSIIIGNGGITLAYVNKKRLEAAARLRQDPVPEKLLKRWIAHIDVISGRKDGDSDTAKGSRKGAAKVTPEIGGGATSAGGADQKGKGNDFRKALDAKANAKAGGGKVSPTEGLSDSELAAQLER